MTTDESAPKFDENSEAGLCFEVEDHRFAISVNLVEQVLAFQSPTPLPNVPGYVLGVIPHNQQALVLFDLFSFLGLQKASPIWGNADRIVVIAGSLQVGIPVRQTKGLIHTSGQSFGELQVYSGGAGEAFIRGEVESEFGLVAWLDLPAILEAGRV